MNGYDDPNFKGYVKSDGTQIKKSEYLDKHFFGTKFGSDLIDWREYSGP